MPAKTLPLANIVATCCTINVVVEETLGHDRLSAHILHRSTSRSSSSSGLNRHPSRTCLRLRPHRARFSTVSLPSLRRRRHLAKALLTAHARLSSTMTRTEEHPPREGKELPTLWCDSSPRSSPTVMMSNACAPASASEESGDTLHQHGPDFPPPTNPQHPSWLGFQGRKDLELVLPLSPSVSDSTTSTGHTAEKLWHREHLRSGNWHGSGHPHPLSAPDGDWSEAMFLRVHLGRCDSRGMRCCKQDLPFAMVQSGTLPPTRATDPSHVVTTFATLEVV